MRLTLLSILLLASPWAASSYARLTPNPITDYIHCIERQECGLDSVCSFALPADGLRCVGKTCVPLTGQIMRVRNGLETDLELAWDAPGSTVNAKNGTSHRPGGPLSIPAHSGRYFDTGLTGAHTVRLYDGGTETLDTTVADWHTECTPNDACHYLLRTCFDHTNPRCTEYARHCGGFAESAEETARRRRCIPNCYSTFFSEDFVPLGSEFDVYTAMDYDIVTQGIAWLIGNGTNVTAYVLAGSSDTTATTTGSGNMGGGTVVVIILLILLVMGAALFFLYLYLQRKVAHTSGTIDFSMDTL